MKILQHLLLISLFIAGLYFPLVWVVLILLVLSQQDREREEHNSSFTILSNPKLDLNHYRSYKQAYIKSPKWNLLRKQILHRDNYTCQKCNATNISLEVHHIRYANFGNEQLSDLVSVCRDCHQSIHNQYGYDYNTNYPI